MDMANEDVDSDNRPPDRIMWLLGLSIAVVLLSIWVFFKARQIDRTEQISLQLGNQWNCTVKTALNNGQCISIDQVLRVILNEQRDLQDKIQTLKPTTTPSAVKK